jgi:hypothetical protein
MLQHPDICALASFTYFGHQPVVQSKSLNLNGKL